MRLYPMNAQECKDKVKQKRLLESREYVAEIKWNGYRQLLIGGEAFSRSKSVVTQMQVSKTEWIPHIAKDLAVYGDWIFDGELLKFPDGKAKDVTSIMQSKKETALIKQAKYGYLTYVIFDVIKTPHDGMINHWPWQNRRVMLDGFFNMFGDHPYIKLSKVAYLHKEEFLNEALNSGKEGIMLKNVNSKWIPSPEGGDSRPANTWYKIKAELNQPEECVIIGFKDPDQYHIDAITGRPNTDRPTKFYANHWIGGVLIGQYVDGKLTPVGSFSGIKDELRKDMSLYPNRYIGKIVSIMAFEREPNGKFISPIFMGFRDDKRDVECTWTPGGN